MFTVSQAAIDLVIRDMQTGASDDFVASFFAARPDWQEEDEEEDEQEGTAQA
jgi:hypothetical protein